VKMEGREVGGVETVSSIAVTVSQITRMIKDIIMREIWRGALLDASSTDAYAPAVRAGLNCGIKAYFAFNPEAAALKLRRTRNAINSR
jgi:hypothetical protein